MVLANPMYTLPCVHTNYIMLKLKVTVWYIA
jgi:hypothetical protein